MKAHILGAALLLFGCEVERPLEFNSAAPVVAPVPQVAVDAGCGPVASSAPIDRWCFRTSGCCETNADCKPVSAGFVCVASTCCWPTGAWWVDHADGGAGP